jgi:hypothetical protein
VLQRTRTLCRGPQERRSLNEPALFENRAHGSGTAFTGLVADKPRKAVLDIRGIVDVERVIDFLTDIKYSGQGVVLLGFADNSGPEPLNEQISRERAEVVAGAFKMRGIRPEVVTGMGSAMPVANNSDLAEREKNRRVEIWITR